VTTLQAVLRRLQGWTGDGPQWEARCPAHTDTKPSLSVTVGGDDLPVFKCQAGCDYADVRAALLQRGVPDNALRPAPRRAAHSRPPAPASRPVRRRTVATAVPVPLPTAARVWRWHERLLADEERLAYLTDVRGLSMEALTQAEVGWDGSRYTIPIEEQVTDDGGTSHRTVNVRRYLQGGKPKWLNWRGHGEARLVAWERLDGATRPVVVTEGEWDGLCAYSHGLYAVATTGGAGTVPGDLSVLTDCEVVVAYDCDDAGRAGARKLAATL